MWMGERALGVVEEVVVVKKKEEKISYKDQALGMTAGLELKVSKFVNTVT